MAEADDNVVEPTKEELTEARELGWVDQEHFRGDPEKWIDAPAFLARGRDVMPLLRKNNERLRGELQQDRQKIKELESAVAAGQESMKELMEFHKENLKTKVAEARQRLLEEITAARVAEDPSAEVEAIGNLTKFDAETAAAAAAPKGNGGGSLVAGEKKEPPKAEPWFEDWLEANPWAKEPSRKTRLANVIAGELRADPKYKDLKGAAFLDKVTEETERELEALGGTGESRVESGGTRPGSRGGNGKNYSDLPADAKATCQRQSSKMVGDGRPFKTEKDWQKYYAEVFFS